MIEGLSGRLFNSVVQFATDYLIVAMIIAIAVALFLRIIIFINVRLEDRFVKEFAKRCRKQALEGKTKGQSFHELAKAILKNTYYESFETRHKYKRRNLDYVTSLMDRIFLVEDGIKNLIQDTLSRTRYLNREENPNPNFEDLSKQTFRTNMVFNRIFGIFPLRLFNDILGILPGLFIIGGIFGTFLGIMKALPDLGGMDISDAIATKEIMDAFLVKISFALSTSIVGIILSVCMTFLNALTGPEGIFYSLVNNYKNALEQLWNEAHSESGQNGQDEDLFDFTKEPDKNDRRSGTYATKAKPASRNS